jgi:hypothetical protein
LAIHLQQQTRARSSLRSFAIFPSASPPSRVVAARDKALAGEKLKTDFLSTMSHGKDALKRVFGNLNLLRDTDLDSNGSLCRVHETSGRCC